MTKLLILFGFVLSFAAGMMAASRFLPPPPDDRLYGSGAPGSKGPATRPDGPPFMRRGFLPRELNLTPEQQTKMREIWSNIGDKGPREMDEKRRDLSQARDAEVVKLIPADKQAEYQKLQADFFEKMQSVDADFRDSFDKAVKQTEALLTDEQRQKYDEIRSRMQPPHEGLGHGFDGEGHGHHGHGPGDHGPLMGPPDGFEGGPGGPPAGPRDGGKF